MRLEPESGSTGKKLPNSMRKPLELARENEKWTDVERRIRQRMRIYPEKLRAMIRSRAEYELEVDQLEVGVPTEGRESAPGRESARTGPKAITSIRGNDVEEIEPEHPLAS